MPDGAEHRTFGKAGLGLVTVGALAATASVVAWSLASPSNDPVGAMVSRVGAGWERLTQWYAGNPVADRPNWSAMQVKLLDAQSDRGPDAMVRYGCGACHVIPPSQGFDPADERPRHGVRPALADHHAESLIGHRFQIRKHRTAGHVRRKIQMHAPGS